MAPSNIPFEYGRSGKDRDIIQSEIHSLLQSGVISKSEGEGGYFSNIFTRPKSDGSARIILNLKSINPYFEKIRFKMSTMKDVINLITPGCYLASIDIRQAYYSVPINESHKKFLRFTFNGQNYHFNVMPNGTVMR